MGGQGSNIGNNFRRTRYKYCIFFFGNRFPSSLLGLGFCDHETEWNLLRFLTARKNVSWKCKTGKKRWFLKCFEEKSLQRLQSFQFLILKSNQVCICTALSLFFKACAVHSVSPIAYCFTPLTEFRFVFPRYLTLIFDSKQKVNSAPTSSSHPTSF